MIPFKTINCIKHSDGAKKIAIDSTMEEYQDFEEEIINNNAVIVIDFMNRYDLTWNCTLENAPQDLVERFKNHKHIPKERKLPSNKF